MKIDISLVPCDKKHILRNMLEIFLYDMSEFDDADDGLELNEAGLYGYNYLDYYWTEDGRYPYIITVDGRLSGFSLVRTIDKTPLTFEIAEFFIMRKYRKHGLGKILINKMFTLHIGRWIINTPIRNIVAQNFWRNVISNNAIGKIEESIIEDGRRIQWEFSNNRHTEYE